MDVLFVYMDADDRLVAGQVLLRKLPRDLQRQLRGDLSGLKGLNEVVILYAALLAHGPLGLQHLPALMARVTVETGCKDLLLGLIPVEHMPTSRRPFRARILVMAITFLLPHT